MDETRTCHLLLGWVNAVFLRSNEIKEGFRSAVKLVQLSILWNGIRRTFAFFMFREDLEQEGSMVEGTVFDSVVQLGNLVET